MKNRLGVYNVNIFTSQMEEDIDLLEYALTNIYSGKDLIKNNGIIISEIFEGVKQKIRSVPSMNTVEFFELLCSALNGIKDSHLIFSLPYFGKNCCFCKHKTVYFADIELKKTDNRYIIIYSGVPHVKCGDEISVTDECIYPTAAGTFLYGAFSEEPIQEVSCVCNGHKIHVPVFPVGTKQRVSDSLWRHECLNEIDIITVHTLAAFTPAEEQQLEKMVLCGKELSHADKIILDLRGNQGGCGEIARRFVENLNGTACLNLNYAKLDSPGSRMAEICLYTDSLEQYRRVRESVMLDPVASWKYTEPQAVSQGKYRNPIVVLTDRYTASSAEIFIKCLKDNIPQTVLIGENTSGTLNTGDVRYFYLPNSLIFLNIPTAVFAGIFEEGTGFLPDYWSSGDAMESAVSYLKNRIY